MGSGFKAIVAMSLNRVIGKQNKLPWHLPEDLRWFKQLTTGNVIIMGRNTWESIGKPLPNRESIVVSNSLQALPGARVVRSIDEVNPAADGREYYIIGGARLFASTLARCSDVFLTLVKREVEGDVFLAPFESDFRIVEKLRESSDFDIYHYRRRT